MKRQIITFLLTMLMSMVGAMALAQTNVSNGSCFTAKTIEGVDVSYMITDISQRTVQVGTSPSNQYWGSDNYASRVAVNTSSYGSVTIPEKVVYGGIEYSVTYIANGAFCGCSQLTDIIIPKSVTHIGHAAFDHCTSLTSIYLPNSVTSIDDGYAFVDCTSLTYVRLSENLKVIPNDTFTRCSSLTTLTIPEGVTNLGKAVYNNKGDAFWKCSALTSVDIPSSVTYYVGNCFSECNNLKTVIVRRAEPVSIESVDNYAFENRKNSTLFVPKGCKTAYENAAVWKEFKEIKELADGVNNAIKVNDYTVCQGGQATLPIAMNNVEQIVGFQFDLQLPEGVTVATNVNGALAATLTDRAGDHSLSASKVGDGLYRFISVSMNNSAFVGNEGALLNVKLKIDESVAVGDYWVKVSDTKLTTASKEEIHSVERSASLTVQEAAPGDVNGDMKVSVSDVASIIGYILNDKPAIFITKAADLNHDNSISVTDAVLAIDIILSQGNTDGSRMKNNTIIDPQ